MEPELHALWLALSTHTSVSVAKNSLYLSKKKKKKKNKPTQNPQSPRDGLTYQVFFTSNGQPWKDSIKSNFAASQAWFLFSGAFQGVTRAVFRNQDFIFINKLSPRCGHTWTLMCYSHFIFFFPYFSLAVLRYYWHVALFKGYNLMIWNV